MDKIKDEMIADQAKKTIDIYQHLRINLKKKQEKCDCETPAEFYCIPCKISVCRNCNYEDHQKHFIVSKNPLEMSPTVVDNAFNEATKAIRNADFIVNYKDIKQDLKEIVEQFSQKLIDQINIKKEEKFKEIDDMFTGLIENANKALANIENIKSQLKAYYVNTHKFFNMEDGGNLDENNTQFLLNYDMMNIIEIKEKEMKTIMNNMSEDANNYKISLDLYGKEVNEGLQKLLASDNSDINSKLLINYDIKREISLNDEEYNPMTHFKTCVQRVVKEEYKEVSDRLIKYLELVDEIQTKVSNTYASNKNLKEIENEIIVFENSKSKGAESLFSQREDKFPSTSINQSALTNRSRMDKLQTPRIYNYSKKEDVILNIPLLKKYFSYMALDLYANYFRVISKELQSSHADLMIKVDPDEEETDYARVVENTNTIIIYERLTNKMTKKKVNLTKNPFGYTLFPIGCRCILIRGKVYITGGRDEKGDYPNVLIYDIQSDNLKRIMDLNEPRAYHTMIYCDVFETIMVLGGEGIDSVEIFDPLANRWQMMPPFNYPRADVVFQFDKPRGMMFALFGREGKILDNKYSDIIEVLDLTEFKKGWCKVEYYNKAEVSLKKYLNVFPLSNCLLLAYGAQTGRKSKRVGVLVNLVKFEIQKIDKQMRELIYCASKKSSKLNNIVANLNLEESKISMTMEAQQSEP